MGRHACPSAEDLGRLLSECLPTADRDRVSDHLEGCTDCQHRLDALVTEGAIASLTRTVELPREGGPDQEYLEHLRHLVSQAAFASWNADPSPEPSGRAIEHRPEAGPACPASIGNYEILQELARGGMAVVYKARQPHLGRIVAVKRLRFRDQDPSDVERFSREGEAVARLRHPNIVQVFQVGEDDGRPFLALEYVHGPTLADYLNGSPVDPRSAAETVRKVASGVHHAHQQGIIHRDLKPANILLDPIGSPRPQRAPGESRQAVKPPLSSFEPRVTDFGLARRVGDDRTLTLPAMLAGTPAYLAPEQLCRKTDAISPACDVYALGAILYEMLTGRPPLLGPTVLATLRLVESADPVAPRSLQPHLSRDLEAVCLKCLAKEPRRRYASAADLAADLDRFLAGRPTVARPVGPLARAAKLVGRHPLAAAAAVLFAAAAAAGLAGILWQWHEAVAARGRLQVALNAEAEQRRDAEENLYFGRLAQATVLWNGGDASQARSLLAACQPTDGRTDLRGWEWHYLSRQFRPETHVVQLSYWVNGLAPLPKTAGGDPELAVAIGRPRMNAADRILPGDGRAGFLRPQDPAPAFRRGPDLPGAATSVAVHPRGAFVAWGTNTGDVVVGRGDTGEVVRVVHTPVPVSRLCVGPDGATLLATGEDAHLRAYDLESGDLIHDQLARVGRPWALAVHPTDSLVACGGGTGVVRLYDPKDWRVVGDLKGHPGGAASLCFSANGASLAVGCGDGTVVLWDPATRQETRRVRSNAGPAYAVALRADGRVLAVGGADRTVRLYDTATERFQTTYRGHESSVRSLAFAAGGGRLISGGHDGTVRVWDATKDVRGRLIPFDGRLNDAGFLATPNGGFVLAASGTGQVKAWSLTDGHPVRQCNLPLTMRSAYPRRYMGFLKGGTRIVGIDKTDVNALGIWDTWTGERVATLSGGRGPVQVLAVDPLGRRLAWATSAGDGAVDVHWRDDDAGFQPPPIQLPTRGLIALALDPTGGRVAAVAAATRREGEPTVWVFDASGADPPKVVASGTSATYGGITFSPDGRLLAVADGDAVRIYRAGTYELAFQVPVSPATTCLTFSPDGRRLAAVGYDGNTTLVDPVAGKRVFQLGSLAGSRPDEMACDARVAFGPDGSWLISTNWDGSINVWDGSPTEE
jgi:WD40 repeat protein